LPHRDDRAVRHVAVQWPRYDVNRQQYIVIGKLSIEQYTIGLTSHSSLYTGHFGDEQISGVVSDRA